MLHTTWRGTESLLNRIAEGIWLEPEIFSPDLDGKEDYLSIHYVFPAPGYRVRILILDPKGRMVLDLVNGALTGRDGFFTWDGRNSGGEMMPAGIYMVLTEVADSNGKISFPSIPIFLMV